MVLIDGKAIAEVIKVEIAKEVAGMIDAGQPSPHLAAILVGDDPAGVAYVAGKEKACKAVGFISSVYKFNADISEVELLKVIDFLNADEEVSGFIVQMPLPSHIDPQKVIGRIDPRKDVDGFHPINLGRMLLNQPCYLPATPAGIMTLLERSNIETAGKHCVVLGRSNIVGAPLSVLMGRKATPGNCTVTLCHSQTQNVKELTLQADILVSAIGKPHFVSADMVKKNAVVIDVGIHRIPDPETKTGTRLIGDVNFNEVAGKCSYITPVPGGVGPMTIVSLIRNTLKASKKEITF